MLQHSKTSDERREAGTTECWMLHGAVGLASDWRGLSDRLARSGIGSRAVDLWRFLDCAPMSLDRFAEALNAEVAGEASRGQGRILVGYSMGGRLALHALARPDHPWQAAMILSAHPGLENETDRAARRAHDTQWATQALAGNWQTFLTKWNEQAIFAGSSRHDAPSLSRLAMRRREIARSFVDWSLGVQAPLWQMLETITVPVLWVSGETDAKFTALAQRAVTHLPRSRHLVAPNVGHRVPWLAEEWLAGQIHRFVQHGLSD